MDYQANLEKKINIQNMLIEFINGNDENYKNLIELLAGLKFNENPHEIKFIIQLINAMYQNHHRTSDFFSRIEKVVLPFKKDIQQFFSNKENNGLFDLNFRFLLFLHKEKMISIENYPSKSYLFNTYFYPELKSTDIEKSVQEISPEAFEEKRQIGENDSYLCTLIRNDSVEEFISFVNKANYSLSSEIQFSPFETNEYLITKRKTTLIEYAAFFGSIQIFQYLRMNNVQLTASLWPCAIHSNIPEMIHLLEENHVKIIDIEPEENNNIPLFNVPKNKPKEVKKKEAFNNLLIEAIKCHHLEILYYLQNYFSYEEDEPKRNQNNNNNNNNPMAQIAAHLNNMQLPFNLLGLPVPMRYLLDSKENKSFKVDDEHLLYPFIFGCYNYICFPEKIDDKMLFYYYVTYGYTTFVEYFLKEKNIDINNVIILIFLFCE